MSDSDNQTPVVPVPPQPTREEIIQKIAQTLIARRQERDLSLEKLSQIIKIRLFYLQAIEKGKWEDLPGDVYVRGFIKRYATFLGLDGDALMAPYLNSSSAPVNDSRPVSHTTQPTDINRLQFLWIGVVGIFIVVFIKLIQKEHTAPITSVSTPVAPVAVSSPSVVSVAPVTPERSVGDKHSIQVFSPYPLWLRVTASEKVFEGFIPQASSWTWKGNGTFVVRFGHTKQVSLLFDGQPVALSEDQRAITLPAAHAN